MTRRTPGSRRHLEPPRLNLTAMVDGFTVLLVFLLKSYAAEGTLTAAAQNLELPASTSSGPEPGAAGLARVRTAESDEDDPPRGGAADRRGGVGGGPRLPGRDGRAVRPGP